MRKLILYSVTLVFLLVNANDLFSQQPSGDQVEVWKTVQYVWKASADGNTDEFMAFFHDDYVGWETSTRFPDNKEAIEKYVRHYFPKRKMIFYDLHPLSIKVYGNVAVVHYYYKEVISLGEGKEKNEEGRWTDIYLKENDKWLLIGDSGGEMEGDD